MGAEETERMLALLIDTEARATRCCSSSTTWTRCSASPTVITVMVNGEVIASDVPEVIRTHPDVRVAYLGEGH